MKKNILFLSFIFIVLTSLVGAESTANIDSRLKGTTWKGSYDLSSGHSGEIQINLGEKESFYFVLPDEEVAYEYVGKIKEVINENGRWIIRAFMNEKKKKGIDIKTLKTFEEAKLITMSFEIILDGMWLKATPGPQEVIEGEISFKGSSPEVQWLLDKNGKFKLLPNQIK